MVLGCVLVLVGILCFTQTSAASKLTLTSPSRHAVETAARCSGDTLTIAINGTTVAVSGINSSACSGKTLAVYVRAGGATQTATATIGGSTANLTLATAATTVDGATATIGTWSVPVSWSAVQPVVPVASCVSLDNPALTCTVTMVSGGSTWGYPTATDWIRYFEISTTSTESVRWAVTLNLSHADLPFVATDLWDNTGSGLVLVSASTCSASPRTVKVKGTEAWGDHHLVTSKKSVKISFHGATSGSGELINC
ncbi:MAG: hypothetical protein AAGC63_04500 [Propionicimonas sp.]|nr:hypothetical protein [Propionicimonas sp.]